MSWWLPFLLASSPTGRVHTFPPLQDTCLNRPVLPLWIIFSICFSHNFPFLPPNLVPILSIILADTHLPSMGHLPVPPATCLSEQFPSGGLPLVHLVPWVICPQSHLLPPPFQDFKAISTSNTVLCERKEPRYYVKSENQLLRCENLGLKNGLYLI